MAAVPAHVPRELVWDHSFDAFTAEGEDPFLALCRLHQGPPLIWATDAAYGRPGWIATRHGVIAEVFRDPAHFSAERPGMPAEMLGVEMRLNPIEIDPPDHHYHRRNLDPLFTPQAVAAWEGAVRRICEQLIDAFPSPRRCEFVREFAIPFPTHVFLDLMDLPRERAADFLAWEETLMRGADFAARAAAARAIYTYLESHLDRQRRAPSNALNRAIVEATFRDRPLTHLERMGMYFVLYVGGLDTVYSTLGWAMREIARDPALQERLRAHPEEISDAVEEFLRAFSVVVTHRQVRRDLHFHGVELRAGDEIHLPLALAGRDPEVFPDPHRIDPGRRPRHLAFGTGVHTCLGRHLARRELRIVLETFLERFPVIRLAPGETYRFHTGRTFGIDSLPLVLG